MLRKTRKKTDMIVSLKCGECGLVYPSDVGTPSTDSKGSIIWEKEVVCPGCQVIGRDLLTEMGQSQMTSYFFGDFLE